MFLNIFGIYLEYYESGETIVSTYQNIGSETEIGDIIVYIFSSTKYSDTIR